MTEVTRVPLQPIAKGSLTKLWLGVLAVALAAAAIAWFSLPQSVKVVTVLAGKGPSPTNEDVALINYKGTLPSGKVFDQQQRAVFPLAEVVPGFGKALAQMQKGGKYKIHIPWQLAYGDKAAGEIPPRTDLDFDVELLDFKSKQEIMAMQAQMQAMQQQMQAQQGGKGGVPGSLPGGMPGGAGSGAGVPQLPPGIEQGPPPPSPN